MLTMVASYPALRQSIKFPFITRKVATKAVWSGGRLVFSQQTNLQSNQQPW